MRIIKNKGLELSPEEYKSLVILENGNYFLKFPDSKPITEVTEQEIIQCIIKGTSKPEICKSLEISETELLNWFHKKYATKKITEVRTKIAEELKTHKTSDITSN